ncbi:uncharacterized protein EV420DRAFT_1651738 [Desarmillaria tabescens]|uniref:Uncharacterized protein n=1 Tax=Armillaria tabescens TaxID=1929756 RepID=A0AA39JBQ1_ARMTA|nr:uncharacterized protein EV420DRAFT_1651738 [Desarmillaria tabescens]KAK0437758.1 hypothetical protein EV420DRAFT_1651738 [Desarmillaria tabescens]
MNKRYHFRRIKGTVTSTFTFAVFSLSGPYDLAIELLNLPPEWDKRSYYLKIFAGEDGKKTNTFKVKKKEHGTTPTPK